MCGELVGEFCDCMFLMVFFCVYCFDDLFVEIGDVVELFVEVMFGVD